MSAAYSASVSPDLCLMLNIQILWKQEFIGLFDRWFNDKPCMLTELSCVELWFILFTIKLFTNRNLIILGQFAHCCLVFRWPCWSKTSAIFKMLILILSIYINLSSLSVDQDQSEMMIYDDNWVKHTYTQFWSNTCCSMSCCFWYHIIQKLNYLCKKFHDKRLHTFEHDCIHTVYYSG